MLKILWIALGGSLGSIARFYINTMFPFNGTSFPKATFIANILASLILGFFTALFIAKFPEQVWIKYLLLIGFCGAFSTFSTFAFEIHTLGVHHLFLTLSYVLASIVFSVAAIALGFYLVKLI